MKSKLFLLSICIMLSITGCGQSQPKDSKLNQVKRDVNVNEYIINYQSTFPICIRINDVPVAMQTEYLGNSFSVFTNWAIPKSGMQILTYTIDLKSYHSRADELESMKSKYSYREIPEVEMEWYATCCGENALSAPENAFRYSLHFDKLTDSDVNKGFYTDTITFEAKVGYDLSDWESGETLNKIDYSLLKEKLYQTYTEMILNLKKEDKDKLDAQWENALYENAVSRNWEKDWAIEEQEGIFSIVPDLLPLDSCELKIYGNGKLATLVSKGQPVPFSALTSTFYDKIFRRNGIQYHNLYFYIPKGCNEFKLIRYDFFSLV